MKRAGVERRLALPVSKRRNLNAKLVLGDINVDPVTAALQVLRLALEIFKIILEDIPKDRREQAWTDWYKFWDPVFAKLREGTPK